MCGVAGLFSPRHVLSDEQLRDIVIPMTKTMEHRGPNAHGHYIDSSCGLALGHRRLSIRDLSPTGAQPMFTAEQRHCIVYNGEIYNAEELRSDLQKAGMAFSGTSDTEVVLHGCAYYGVETFVQKIIGMFAFAFWDAAKKRLSIVRDRLGIKPLYYTNINEVWAFSSELKALYHHPYWRGEICRNATTQFLRYGYIHAPHSIYKNTYKLLPGTMLHFYSTGEQKTVTYWSAKEKILHGQQNIYTASDDELIDSTHTLLKDAVKRRMVADVPLGAFLSGGIDSSLVVALMQNQSMEKVRTFSIGFEEKHYNEAPFAKAVAQHLGTNHTEHYMSAKDAFAVIPKLAGMYDEPFADSSQLPTSLLSAITQQHVTVALSGDGGDELFAGYGRYFSLNEKRTLATPFWQLADVICKHTPQVIFNIVAKGLPARYQSGFARRLQGFISRRNIHKDNYMMTYRETFMTHWAEPENVVLGGHELTDIFSEKDFLDLLEHRISQMQAADTMQYLNDSVLTKVDRASMATSLEVRVPLLDHRVFEHAWKLPMHLKVKNNTGKVALRKVLAQYVPTKLFERPKMGFGVPIDIWLRGSLREWAESLLDEKTLQEQGLLNTDYVRNKWNEHLNGGNWPYLIWDVLMLQEFLRLNKATLSFS